MGQSGTEKINLNAKFKKFHRCMKPLNSKNTSESKIASNLDLDKNWCYDVLKTRSKLLASSQSKVDAEQIFSTMS